MHRNSLSSANFEDVIKRLKSNKDEWNSLSLAHIINEPTHHFDQNYGGYTVSHITNNSLLELAKALENNSSIESIIINGMNSTRTSFEWDETGAKAIGNALKNHPKLNSVCIDLKTSDLSDTKIIGFLHCLAGSANITNLRVLTYCESADFIKQLSSFLQANNRLQSIHLGVSPSNDSQYDEETLTLFANSFANKKIKHLTLNNLNIGDVGIEKMTSVFSKLTTLQSLTLQSCGISAVGALSINEMLKNMIHLTELDLSYNSLQSLGINTISTILPSLKKLNKLNLSKTELDAGSLETLVTTWRQHNLAISHLRIGTNKIDNAAIHAIIKLIDGNQALLSLDMSFSHINDDQLVLMAPILSDPTRCHLEILEVVGSQALNQNTYKLALSVLEKNEKLTELHLPVIYDPHKKIMQANEIKKKKRYAASQHAFLNAAIELCHCYFSKAEKNKESSLLVHQFPIDILRVIMEYLGEATLGMSKEDIATCNNQIIENFKHRRTQIDSNNYTTLITTTSSSIWFSQHKPIASMKEEKVITSNNATPHKSDKKKCNVM